MRNTKPIVALRLTKIPWHCMTQLILQEIYRKYTVAVNAPVRIINGKLHNTFSAEVGGAGFAWQDLRSVCSFWILSQEKRNFSRMLNKVAESDTAQQRMLVCGRCFLWGYLAAHSFSVAVEKYLKYINTGIAIKMLWKKSVNEHWEVDAFTVVHCIWYQSRWYDQYCCCCSRVSHINMWSVCDTPTCSFQKNLHH